MKKITWHQVDIVFMVYWMLCKAQKQRCLNAKLGVVASNKIVIGS